MKLVDITGDRAFEVLSDIVDPVANIVSDADASEIFIRKSIPKDVDARAFVVNRIKKAIPQLLKTHKDDFITIVSLINGVDREEYTRNVSLPSLIIDVSELINDELFCAFFTFAQRKET